jgi:hypothetical protein
LYLLDPGRCTFFQGHISLPVDPIMDVTTAPHPRFPVQGHILSTSGDALSFIYSEWSQIELRAVISNRITVDRNKANFFYHEQWAKLQRG